VAENPGECRDTLCIRERPEGPVSTAEVAAAWPLCPRIAKARHVQKARGQAEQ
jgi:hypothetical protein